ALVTAGPTYEKIDPVRFIGNYSSGKMGYSIVTALQERGCEVTLITGPTSIPVPEVHKVIRVTSAHEMYHACLNEYHGKDMLILAAAVADFTPTETAPEKIKKKETEMVLHLQQTTDIARELGIKKSNNQLLIGFALETQHEEENARKKLLSKNFDMIVLNSLKDSGAGFQHDTNKITIFDKEGNTTKFKLKSKSEVALDIIKAIESKMDV
ncbi:MAG: phosphopantothenoylcysteine decarboxylase, partial [Cyclobacteriaceae bacterium]|nr:phosphopantothenoylcysteine decarboxylase [Cyclobacteriaceae bacterium]